MHWSVSEGSIEVDKHAEEDHEALKAEVDKYKDKIFDFKSKNASVFERDQKVKEHFEKNDLTWKEFQEGYPKDTPYTGKTAKFNMDYVLDMYEAAKKDNRKKELKAKYLDQKGLEGRKGDEQFRRDFSKK